MPTVGDIRSHYDHLSPLYWLLWGEHIHHGLWNGDGSGASADSPAAAQRRLVEHLANAAQIEPGSAVLDIGCGLGGSSLWLARNLDCQVRGITISRVQARICGLRARLQGLAARTRFDVMDANNLHCRDQVDVVWVIECAEHLFDQPAFFARCAQVLKPGGRLAICTWLRGDDVDDDAPQRQDHAELLQSIRRAMLCPTLLSRSELDRALDDAGFIERLRADLSARVAATWPQASGRVAACKRRFNLLLRPFLSPSTRAFIQAMPLMHQALLSGALIYHARVAMRSGSSPSLSGRGSGGR